MLEKFMKRICSIKRQTRNLDNKQDSHTACQATVEVSESLKRGHSIGIALAIFCTGILALVLFTYSVCDFVSARRNLYDLETHSLALDVANLFSAERWSAITAIASESAAGGLEKQHIEELRQRTDAALIRLSSRSVSSFGLRSKAVPQAMLRAVVDELAHARRHIDRLAAIPRQHLKADDIHSAIEGMLIASDRLRLIFSLFSDRLIYHNANLAAAVLSGQMVADISEHGGRMFSQVITSVIFGQALPAVNKIDSRHSQGSVIALWNMIDHDAAVYQNEALVSARMKVTRMFLAEGLTLIDMVIRQGSKDGRYSVTAAELADRFIPTLQPLETFRYALLDTATRQYRDARAQALTTLIAVGLVTIFILAILAGLLLSLRRHIFQPLLEARHAVLLSASDRPIQLASMATRGEVKALLHAIEILSGQFQQRAAQLNQLKYQAETDYLTSLLNRRALDQIVRNLTQDHNSGTGRISLILIDIDHFKMVNDNYGHLTGDKILMETAALLRSHVQPGYMTARFGGEEFAIVAPETDLVVAIATARKLKAALQRHRFIALNGETVNITASFGVATGRKQSGHWLALVKQADTALYRAKADGRNRIRFSRTDSSEHQMEPG